MIKFNSNNIIAGYIKQLLSSFNLPTIAVFKEGETTPFENTCYIKDNKIQLYKDQNWIDKGKYYFGADLALNDSKTLKISEPRIIPTACGQSAPMPSASTTRRA